MKITIDSREPWPHPWARYWPEDLTVERGAMETGDIALAVLPDGSVIERKTVGDMLGCIGGNRERFERELKRSRYLGSFCIVVEGSLDDLLEQSRGLHPNAILGTLAAWQRRYCPIFLAGSERTSAAFALRYLQGQVAEVERMHGAVVHGFSQE